MPEENRLGTSQEDGIRPDIRLGFVLVPEFALSSFASFCEPFRHAADEADWSRQIRCKWTVMTVTNGPVASSSGIVVEPWIDDDGQFDFDYLVVVGGRLDGVEMVPAVFHEYLRQVRSAGIPLIGTCFGVFVLGDAGLLAGRRCTVHWREKEKFARRFPDAVPDSEQPFQYSDGIYTAMGGISSMHLALSLIGKHCGPSRVRKCVDFMTVESFTLELHNRPKMYEEYLTAGNRTLERAVSVMCHWLGTSRTINEIAEEVGTSRSQLDRTFKELTGRTVWGFWRMMRLTQGRWSLANSSLSITQIAHECGFADASHFTRAFKSEFSETPGAYRDSSAHASRLKEIVPIRPSRNP